MRKSVSYANNKGADQPAHHCSLVSTFGVHCLLSIDSITAVEMRMRTAYVCMIYGLVRIPDLV